MWFKRNGHFHVLVKDRHMHGQTDLHIDYIAHFRVVLETV